MSFFRANRQTTRIAKTVMRPQTSTAESPLFFPDPRANFGVSLEPVPVRQAWFQKMPQPAPVRNIRMLNRIFARVVPLKNGKA